jgi:RNA 3'-terminal phosphate cyclase
MPSGITFPLCSKQVPDFINLADEFLEESHFYLRESPEQTKLENRITEFRASFDTQNVSSTGSEKSSNADSDDSINEVAGKAGDIAKKAGSVAADATKKAWSSASDVGSKVADRIKNACWYNCD